MVGTCLRYGMQLMLPASGVDFPVGVLLINWVGCLFLGWFFTVTLRSWQISPRLRLAIGTGLTGGFTTFSTFTVDSVRLWSHGQAGASILYILASIIGGPFLVWTGVRLGKRMTMEFPREDSI